VLQVFQSISSVVWWHDTFSNDGMKTILFIHGLNANKAVWNLWCDKLEQQGYTCKTLSYPYHDGVPSELRKNPDERLRKIRLKDVVLSYARFIQALPEKPFLIGHSMGGLVVQKLIEVNLGVAGICLSSAPPLGLFSFRPSFIYNNSVMINLLKGNSVFIPSQRWFHQAIANTLERKLSDKYYEKFVVPESRQIPRSILLDGKINFRKPHAPLLFIAAEHDRIVPNKLNRKNAAAYKNKDSITEFKEFKGKSHLLCWESGWEEVLAYCTTFIARVEERSARVEEGRPIKIQSGSF